MKNTFTALLFFALFLFAGQATAQTKHGHGSTLKAEIAKLKYGNEGKYFIVDYELPYAGMMEIRIYDDKEELVWQEQYINGRGANKIKLKAAAFQTGSNYTIQLNYKRDVVREKVKMG